MYCCADVEGLDVTGREVVKEDSQPLLTALAVVEFAEGNGPLRWGDTQAGRSRALGCMCRRGRQQTGQFAFEVSREGVQV